MIRSKGITVVLFTIISILTMVGCGGSAAQPQAKTTTPTPPTPPAAVVFQGTFNLTFSDNINDAMDVNLALTQTESNVTGKSSGAAGYHRSGLNATCIDLANVTVTGTVQGSNFAMILTDPSRSTVNISGTISPLQGNYSTHFTSPCGYGSSITGTVVFQKMAS